jgi:hypothetical protein
MKRRFTAFLMVCSVFFLQTRCSDDEASAPPRSSFTVDKTSGLANDTEFTFVVDQVDAEDISLLPYGSEKPNLGGIRIAKSSFKDGKATVKFTYAEVGSFNAVVVTTNHTADGESVKSATSDTKAIDIKSDRNAFSDLTLEERNADGSVKYASTGTKVVGNTFTVTVPYGTDETKLVAKYTVSPFTTVTVGSTAQSNGTTVNNFSSPVDFVVTANQGDKKTYTVVVEETPIEKLTTIKSFSGKIASKADKDKALGSSVDNTNHLIVLYGTPGTNVDRYDSVRVKAEADGKFAYAKFGTTKLKADSLLNLSSSKTIKMVSQDSVAGTTQDYEIFATTAPAYNLKFAGLNPEVTGTADGFTITLKVLKGTPLTNLIATETISRTVGTTTINGVKVNGVTFTSGTTALNYSSNLKFELSVTDSSIGNKTYTVVYTVSVLELN